MHSKIAFLFLTVFFCVGPSHADGVHFSDEKLHLELPDQKAIISWDGKTQEMILSSAIRATDLSNIVWVVPIQSSVKPEVQAADISVFKDLVDYFKDKTQPIGRTIADPIKPALSEMKVQVVEAKKLMCTTSLSSELPAEKI